MRSVISAFTTITLILIVGPLLIAQERKPTPDNQTQTVVAEGVGTTADEALKDAFRNAVRQVVGAIVDAETQVENDKVITDKVLTYSDGFIKRYSEIDGSKEVSDGLHKIRIKAAVEKKELLAKLRSSNVATKSVDGNQLFAQTVSQLEADRNAAAIIEKQFEVFPQSLIKASVVGDPEIVKKTESTANVKFIVQVEPDHVAYKIFSDRLKNVLDKMSKAKGDFAIVFANNGRPQGTEPSLFETFRTKTPVNIFAACRKAVQSNTGRPDKDSLIIALGTTNNKTRTKMDFSYYEVSGAIIPTMRRVEALRGIIQMELLGDESKTIAIESFRYDQKFVSNLDGFIDPMQNTYLSQLYMIAPAFVTEFPTGVFTSFDKRNYMMGYNLGFQKSVEFKLGLEELKALRDIRVEYLDGTTPIPKGLGGPGMIGN